MGHCRESQPSQALHTFGANNLQVAGKGSAEANCLHDISGHPAGAKHSELATDLQPRGNKVLPSVPDFQPTPVFLQRSHLMFHAASWNHMMFNWTEQQQLGTFPDSFLPGKAWIGGLEGSCPRSKFHAELLMGLQKRFGLRQKHKMRLIDDFSELSLPKDRSKSDVAKGPQSRHCCYALGSVDLVLEGCNVQCAPLSFCFSMKQMFDLHALVC